MRLLAEVVLLDVQHARERHRASAHGGILGVIDRLQHLLLPLGVVLDDEPERPQHLVEQAFLARRIGDLDAFLLAFDQDARYDSPNFLWFCARYPRFVYVDRIVVASSARGRGCARRLYGDLFEHAAEAGHKRVVCEVNTGPPNPASDAFHAALGFVEVGTASVYDGSRTVRYLSHAL